MTGTGIFDDWSGRWIFGNDVDQFFYNFSVEFKIGLLFYRSVDSKLEA